MVKKVFISCFAMAILLAAVIVIPCHAADPDPCADARDAVLNARNALSTYFSAKGEYPEKLSVTNFSSPGTIVVIYEKMSPDSAKQFYMVRAYGEKCATMYMTVPTTSEVFRIPLAPGAVEQAGGKTPGGKAAAPPDTSSVVPFIISTAIFFTVFTLVFLAFYIRNSDKGTGAEPEKDTPPPPPVGEQSDSYGGKE